MINHYCCCCFCFYCGWPEYSFAASVVAPVAIAATIARWSTAVVAPALPVASSWFAVATIASSSSVSVFFLARSSLGLISTLPDHVIPRQETQRRLANCVLLTLANSATATTALSAGNPIDVLKGHRSLGTLVEPFLHL